MKYPKLTLAKGVFFGTSTASLAAALAISTPAYAQQGAEQAGEIIVTARKREETQIEVPVTISAVGKEQLNNYAISTIDSVARAVPSLIVGEGGGTIQGGIIAIRGLAGSENNPLNDQAVSFNIDGISIGRATVRRMSELDLQQIEVLKGPQALFFGKNSPAGIISIRTADPTEELEAKISAGYEFKAREWRTEAYISTPITDKLGFRLAGSYSDMKGWAKNVVPRDFPNAAAFGILPLDSRRAPDKTDWAVRGTLKYDDGDKFDARLKLTYSKVNDSTGLSGNTQFVSCPLGRPQNSLGLPSGAYIDDCRADDKNSGGTFNETGAKTVFPSRDWHDGHLFMRQYQILGGLEMNYHVAKDVTLTSVTGFYKQDLDSIGNYTQSYFNDGAVYNVDSLGNLYPFNPAGPGAAVRRWDLASYNEIALREFSQELRVTSAFDGPFNFMVGGLYTNTRGGAGGTSVGATSGSAALGLPNGAPVNHYFYEQKGESWSVFGQAIFNPIEQIEISAGARASWERKRLTRFEDRDTTPGNSTQLIDVGEKFNLPNLQRKVKFDNVSPEFTVAYKPTRDLNIYASYKEGFLSGGFAALTPSGTAIANGRHIYDPQETKGFEGGIKAALLDRTLRLNLAYYNYKTTGLQVGLTIAGVQQVLLNAASVRTEGVEFDFSYKTPIEGLTLNGAINYNKAKYLNYIGPCYRGQASEECFLQSNPLTGLTDLYQNLSGSDLVRAPRWAGNAGFNYQSLMGNNFKVGLSGNVSFSDSYFTDAANSPGGRQPRYTLFDASLRFGDAEDRWEVAIIGKNLTDKYYFVRASDSPFTGSNPGQYSANDPLRLLSDTAASVSRGREIWVRLSYKFGGN